MSFPLDNKNMFTGEISGLVTKLNNLPDLKVRESLCCWQDLLGFGSPLYECDWNPTEETFKEIYKRLTTAQKEFFSNLSPFNEFGLVLNDGSVKTTFTDSITSFLDLSFWLRGCVITHLNVNRNESENGYPGARTVLTHGKAMSHSHPEFRFDDFVFTYTKKDPNGLSQIAEDRGNPLVAINPTPMQMNMAFSKAYILDNGGSKIGLSGSNFYLDNSVLEYIRNFKNLFSPDSEIVEDYKDNIYIFVLPSKDSVKRYVLGFELENPSIKISAKHITTQVWKVISYYPWDEDFDEFKFKL